jgi:FecR protein
MNVRHPFTCLTATLICSLLMIPTDVVAQATQATEPQHAGKLTAVLPVVNVIRGPQQTPASTSEAIYWGDVINTGHLARARVALDDGSVLSVGSDSNLTVTKHDAAEQQTDLDLNYGRVRAKAVKQVKPNANFQIRTPTGVAGVVGTDFALDSEGDTTRIVVYEGKVNFCAYKSKKKEEQEGAQGGAEAGAPAAGGQDQNEKEKNRRLLGPCVIVGAGESSSVQFNAAPTPPVPATPVTVTEMTSTTSVGGATGAAGGIGVAGATAIGVGAAVAVTVAAVVIRAASNTQTCSSPAAAAHVVPSSNCTAINNAARGKAPGQRP